MEGDCDFDKFWKHRNFKILLVKTVRYDICGRQTSHVAIVKERIRSFWETIRPILWHCLKQRHAFPSITVVQLTVESCTESHNGSRKNSEEKDARVPWLVSEKQAEAE